MKVISHQISCWSWIPQDYSVWRWRWERWFSPWGWSPQEWMCLPKWVLVLALARVGFYKARLALMFNFCTYLVPSSSLPYMEQHEALTGSHVGAGNILLNSRNCEKLWRGVMMVSRHHQPAWIWNHLGNRTLNASRYLDRRQIDQEGQEEKQKELLGYQVKAWALGTWVNLRRPTAEPLVDICLTPSGEAKQPAR